MISFLFLSSSLIHNPFHFKLATGVVSFDAFSKIAMRADGFKPAGTTDQLIEGFKVFDPLNNGTIPATELRHGRISFFHSFFSST
jgi:hypothetical protein